MKMNFFLQLFVLCYALGMGSLITIVIAESFASKYPNTKLSKYWRRSWIADESDKQTK